MKGDGAPEAEGHQASAEARIALMKDRAAGLLGTARDWAGTSTVVVVCDHELTQPFVHVTACVDERGSLAQIDHAAENTSMSEDDVRQTLKALRADLKFWPILQAACTLRDMIEAAGLNDLTSPARTTRQEIKL